MKQTLSIVQKKVDQDLNIIAILTMLPLIGYLFFQQEITDFTHQSSFPIWLRLLFLAMCQFGAVGLGTSVVLIRRKESWKEYGLVTKHFLPSCVQTAITCLPLLLFLIITGQVHTYLPFQSISLTKEILASSFPTNILGYLLISLIWGFWEGFNYVVISRKINLRYPRQNKKIDLGALICALICLLVHGMIGLDATSLFEAIAVFILIYGMLVIQKRTRNAWNCILVFCFFWNAF